MADDTIDDFLVAGRYRLQEAIDHGGWQAADQVLGQDRRWRAGPPSDLKTPHIEWGRHRGPGVCAVPTRVVPWSELAEAGA
jgi:hypothetical protein